MFLVDKFFSPKKNFSDLSPDEIFVDATNLPSYDKQQFEGQIEKPISRRTFQNFTAVCLIVGLFFLSRVFYLQVVNGANYAERSRDNSLSFTPILAERGNIYDRLGRELAWTDKTRVYLSEPGFGHLLGYVGYPNKEEMSSGLYDPKEYLGRTGVERQYNNKLLGERGVLIVEVNARGEKLSDHIVKKPSPGQELKLSIDYRVQKKFYEIIEQLALERGFLAGSGIIMDVRTGEILSLVNYPDYDSNILSEGKDVETINQYFSDKRNIMLNRPVGGLYTPGSVFKPFVVLGALAEKTINPTKTFVSTGELAIINPYDRTQRTIFRDWKAHGVVDMRRALAVSSNVYFYIIAGGFGDQRGLGIDNIGKYARLFGLSQKTGIDLPGENEGVIPSPDWKERTFDGEPWRLGDTYHTAIGQYGVLVTPIQMVRAYAAIANKGKLIQPTILSIEPKQAVIQASIPIGAEDFKIIHEGLRQAVLEGTAQGLNLSNVEIAAKTGTAELGTAKEEVNSWIAGFWPYQSPRFAFVVTMERGSRSNLVGGVAAMRQLFDWLTIYASEYL